MVRKRKDKLKERYQELDGKIKLPIKGEKAIRADLLISFDFAYPDKDTEIDIDTEEFTALCPWTGLPDSGTLSVHYVPSDRCLELKSFKYYLLSFRSVGIVQEHVAHRVLEDLVAACAPKHMTVVLDYRMRGGLHTVVTAQHTADI